VAKTMAAMVRLRAVASRWAGVGAAFVTPVLVFSIGLIGPDSWASAVGGRRSHAVIRQTARRHRHATKPRTIWSDRLRTGFLISSPTQVAGTPRATGDVLALLCLVRFWSRVDRYFVRARLVEREIYYKVLVRVVRRKPGNLSAPISILDELALYACAQPVTRR